MSSAPSAVREDLLAAYMGECRELVLDEIRDLLPPDGAHTGGLYELMFDYPLRGGKALRPAVCVATCRALGGQLQSVLRSAAVLELYHNAFLIHDDVEDGSEKRRREATLHRAHGVPIAVNVGDGMLALTMKPLLDNMETIGLGRALRILETVARMARESAEGQMMELDWIRRADWTPSDRCYLRMVYKKSAWYSFVAPTLVGGIAAGARDAALDGLARFAALLGTAFQIQDDVLNLVGDEGAYGKEIDGDLWEGKHTLILIHAMRRASRSDRARALAVLGRARPPESGEACPHCSDGRAQKTPDDVAFLRGLIERHGSIAYAWAEADRRARAAERRFRALSRNLPESVHREFLGRLVDFVVQRDR
jgi:geranylgeranyl diphosphate synthase, type II